MRYLEEFRVNRRSLLAASLGMGVGYSLNNYLNNVFIPPLVQEFQWSHSSVALIGVAAMVSFIVQPLAGWFTDRLGVRIVALFGAVVGPLIYLALSMMQGSFVEFFVLNALQITLVASTTGAVVFSRLIAEGFYRARGMALGLIACSPSVLGIAIAPLLTQYIHQHGWRSGYLFIAGFVLVTSLIAVAAIPPRPRAVPIAAADAVRKPGTLKQIIANPAFKFILAGMALCSLSIMMQATQLKLILEHMGIESGRASWMISLYATGVILGRILCGASLDRFPSHIVAAIALGLPAVGLSMIATGSTVPFVMPLAVLLLGLSLGTELDVAGYLIMRFFDTETYSTVLGIVVGSLSLSGAVGAVILSLSLKVHDSYVFFLLFSALAAFFGSSLFLKLGKLPPRNEAE